MESSGAGGRGTEPAGDECVVREETVKLESVSTALAGRTLRYVMTGEGADVLAAIRGAGACALALGLKCATPERRWEMRPVDALSGDDVVIRLGHVFAAAHPSSYEARFAELGVPLWLESLMFEGSSVSPAGGGSFPVSSRIPLARLRRLLLASGESDACLARMTLRGAGASPWSLDALHGIASAWDGRDEVLAAHREVVATALAAQDAAALADCLLALLNAHYDPAPVAVRLAELLCDDRKSVRTAAVALARERPVPAVTMELRRLAAEGDATQRFRAWESLSELGDADLHVRAAEALGAERTPRVRKLLAAIVAAQSAPSPAALVLPPRRPVAPPGPLSPAQLAAIEAYAARAEALRLETKAEHPAWKGLDRPVNAAAAIASIADPRPWTAHPDAELGMSWHIDVDLAPFVASTEWGLVHLLRFAYHARRHEARPDWVYPAGVAPLVTQHRMRTGSPGDLRELAEAAEWLGYAPDHLANGELCRYGWRSYDWEPEAVWPYYAERVPLLAAEFAGSASWHISGRGAVGAVLSILAIMPAVPEALLPDLWRLALAPTKAHRAEAQTLLSKVPGVLDRVVHALDDSQQEVRATAAEWLGSLRDARAVPAIEARLAKERSDLVRAALLTSLEMLGRPIDAYIDRQALAAEARKGLAKVPPSAAPVLGIPLPSVRWADSGETVAEEVIRWWLVKAAKLKQEAPDALLRRYVGLFAAPDRHALGEAITSAWIAEDTRLRTALSPAELQAITAQAQQSLSLFPQLTLDQLERRMINQTMAWPVGSANAWKGCLAVAAACGGPRIVAMAAQYLREWYGTRAAQSRALLAVLAWLDDPAATQLLLATATRFRSPGIQKEAERHVRELAERRGWTLDELADRTLPDAGFDRDGRRTIEYLLAVPEGAPPAVSRRFTARLLEDLSIALEDESGHGIKALPDARAAEDEASVAAAKKSLTAMRKDLQKFVAQQRMRLYEAMCSGRRWAEDDWRRYLLDHVVMRHLCRRVVWTACGDETALFRPLEDGSLTNASDDEVVIAGRTIGIAHGSQCPPEAAAAWAAHFADFEAEPLLDQFPAAMVDLPDAWRAANEITAVRGHMIRAFALRAVAARRSYLRGPPVDGGWFTEYRKHFPALGVAAVVQFTGNDLPEKDRDTALDTAFVERLSDPGSSAGMTFGQGRVPLGQVSPVLLSELRADLAAFSAAGTGFDPDWEKKAG